ncbi:MAG: aminomethyl-transferring glycine dehydrogenase subunit GcvPB [Tannerella sp.]|jgi:glycine dehydrogenase subunit 2|nr:aminomethyl-transferring glycine dehydrogenase subunit GcvPB [Tannerella sp.]
MKLLFEISKDEHGCDLLPAPDVPEATLPEEMCRKTPLDLPQLSETELSRHYTRLAQRTFGVNSGFYPLGSCTMKYNPRINEELAALPGFCDIHPLQPEHTVQGCMEVLSETGKALCEITGMDAVTFQPAAGAHGELLGVLLIKAWHESRGDLKRTKILIPDAAHGTNPASAAMGGFTVVNIPSGPDGCVDVEKLRRAAGEDTAGLMLTNPNTLGLFDRNILEITGIIHDAGGLNYYDGANLNPVMGIVRPGDMGFDLVHLNIHKTFSTPHGGGGPGSGPVGCKAILSDFLPACRITEKNGSYTFDTPVRTIGSVKAFYGHFLVVVRALAYIRTLGAEGIRRAATHAVLNANYMRRKLSECYDMATEGPCMHEFVITLQKAKEQAGVTALDVAKALLDYGIHPPTMYFPLIVPEALMVEPTETESKETMDEAIEVFKKIAGLIRTNPERLHEMPLTTPVRRPDEVGAARNPRLKYGCE